MVHSVTSAPEACSHTSDAIERCPGKLLVDQMHQMSIMSRFASIVPVIQTGSGEPQKLALPAYRNSRVIEVHQCTALINREIQIFFSASPTPP